MHRTDSGWSKEPLNETKVLVLPERSADGNTINRGLVSDRSDVAPVGPSAEIRSSNFPSGPYHSPTGCSSRRQRIRSQVVSTTL